MKNLSTVMLEGKGTMSTLKISKHSDVPAALDLVRGEVDKEAWRIDRAGVGCGLM